MGKHAPSNARAQGIYEAWTHVPPGERAQDEITAGLWGPPPAPQKQVSQAAAND